MKYIFGTELQPFQRIFGIDLRTMALFRICLGASILTDLINRTEFLKAFYTDQGVMTRIAAIEYNHPARFSLHLMSGSPLVISILFGIAMLLAVLLILGYRTRIVTVLSWIFLVSLNNRNLIVQQGGDQLLTILCFWAMFLPLGARFSIDAALRPDDQPRPQNHHFSIATVAMLLQVIYVYVIGALLKVSPDWIPNGEAVYYALQVESLATPLAHWFRQFGPILTILTYFVWTIEFSAPFLIFSPIWHVPVRLVTQVMLICMHIGFYLFLSIGLFPMVSITSLTLFTLPEVWDWIAKRAHTAEMRAIKIYYDGTCGFCLKTAKIFRTFCLSDEVPILPAQDDPKIRPIFEAEDSWVVTDHAGNTYTKWVAVAFVLRQSWIFWIFGKLFTFAPLAWLGDRLYRLIGDNRKGVLGALSARFLPYRRQWLRLTWVEAAAVGALMVMVFLHNVSTIPSFNYRLPEALDTLQKGLRLHQTWDMFAPRPLRASGWFVVRGELEDGTVIDLWTGKEGEPDPSKPKYVVKWYPDYRWRKYLSRVPLDGYEEQLHNFARYYCRKYNVFEPGLLRLYKIEIDYHREWTMPDYQPREYKKIHLLDWFCFERKKAEPDDKSS